MTNTALYEKLSLAMKSCSYIEKTGENTFHGYSYVTSSDVLERVNDALTSVGLITVVTPTLLDLREVQTAKGNIDKHATISVTISIIDVETGESVQISGIGSGQDSGDKAIMKAETAAIKYAYMLSFCIALVMTLKRIILQTLIHKSYHLKHLQQDNQLSLINLW